MWARIGPPPTGRTEGTAIDAGPYAFFIKSQFCGYPYRVIPLCLLKIAPLVAAMQIVVATLPSGDVESVRFVETEDGVQALVSRKLVRSDTTTKREQFLKRGRYTWKIEEEHRIILMAPPGQPTGLVRQAFAVAGWIDNSRLADDAPHPVEVFRFYAPTKEAALAMRDRLKKGLGKKE